MSNKWTDEKTAKLKALVGKVTPVEVATVDKAAAELEVTPNSAASKLRKLGYEVVSRAKSGVKAFTDQEQELLATFMDVNPNKYTYAEIAAGFLNGKFGTKQIQGKLLSMELTGSVKPTEKVETVKTYTDAEEAIVLKMINDGAFVEDIAEAVDKSIASVRGKALSFYRSNPEITMPKQRESHAVAKEDALEALGDVSEMLVADIATAIGKAERGVKTMLTHRGINCADHKGAARREKIDAKKKAA